MSGSVDAAVIVGAQGQDGRLLGEQLERVGRRVVGLGRGDIDVLDRAAVEAQLRNHHPKEVYYLAAHHHSSQDAFGGDEIALFRDSFAVHVTGLLNFLDAMRSSAPRAKIFYAASSHVFGQSGSALQNEQTPLAPTGVYGITKTAGMHCCRYYRETHGLFAATGILYNHESPYRRSNFVSRRIIEGVRAIAAGRADTLVLGDLSARIDWGYAPDFVEAMQLILAQPAADDFVVATGESHSVQEFVEIAFEAAGLDWRRHVTEDPDRITRKMRTLTGDASKLRAFTGWKPSVSFRDMVKRLLDDASHE